MARPKTYRVMVKAAVKVLGASKGSDPNAIARWIMSRYANVDKDKRKVVLNVKMVLKRGLKPGRVNVVGKARVETKRAYRLPRPRKLPRKSPRQEAKKTAMRTAAMAK